MIDDGQFHEYEFNASSATGVLSWRRDGVEQLTTSGTLHPGIVRVVLTGTAVSGDHFDSVLVESQ
jgi:hypothetical protein